MNFLRGAIFFLTAMLIQWWWATHFSLAGLAPQLLLILTVVVAARQGPVRAMCLGFGWGLFLDVLNPALFGANALALTLAGYGTGALRRLEQLIQEAVVTVPRALIAETIDLVAVLSGRGSARRLSELARVDGLGPDGDYRVVTAVVAADAPLRLKRDRWQWKSWENQTTN